MVWAWSLRGCEHRLRGVARGEGGGHWESALGASAPASAAVDIAVRTSQVPHVGNPVGLISVAQGLFFGVVVFCFVVCLRPSAVSCGL